MIAEYYRKTVSRGCRGLRQVNRRNSRHLRPNIKKRRRKTGALWGGGRGTLTLRSKLTSSFRLNGFRWQFPNGRSDILVVVLAILHRDTSSSNKITGTLRLRIERETYLFS